MKLKDIIADKFILWCIRIILGCVAGILLLFFYLKILQAYHTTKLINQVSEVTEDYIDYESQYFSY